MEALWESPELLLVDGFLPPSFIDGPTTASNDNDEEAGPVEVKEHHVLLSDRKKENSSSAEEPSSGIDVNAFQDLQPPSRAPYSPYSSLTPHTTATCLKVSTVDTNRPKDDPPSTSSRQTRQQQQQDFFTKQTQSPKLLTLPSTGELAAFIGRIDVISGQPQYGRLVTQEQGHVYDGPFLSGKRHGDNATLHDVSQCLKFAGSFRDDMPHAGSLISPTFVYRGELDEQLKFHSNGSLATRDGVLYEGEFAHGRYEGVGREVRPDGTLYKGQFVSGNRHGIGTLFVPRKERDAEEEEKEREECSSSTTATMTMYSYSYSGVWWHGNMEGEGHEIIPSTNEAYTGQFFRSKRHGFGILKLPSRAVAEGTWRAGLPVDGAGWSITYPNGDKYHGCVVGFEPHGVGIMIHAPRPSDSKNGDDTNEGRQQHQRQNSSDEEEVYYGQFHRGKRQGEGLCVTRHGPVRRGIWFDDRLVEVIDEAQRHTTSAVPSDTNERPESNEIGDRDRYDATEQEASGIGRQIVAANLSGGDGVVPPTSREPTGTLDDDDSNDEDTFEIDIDFGSSLDTFSLLQRMLPDGFVLPYSILENKDQQQGDTSSVGATSPSRNGEADRDSTVHRYPNSDTYDGHLDESGLRQGHGRYAEHRSGAAYDGEWQDNKRHGRGVLVTSRVKYCGEYREDRRQGQGTLIWNDSSCYTGQFHNDIFHGVGTLCDNDGVTYTGDWREGLRHGEGLETFADGTVFLGEYTQGKRHGVGTLLEKKGGAVMYSGHWANGDFHGEGVRVFKHHNSEADAERDPSSYDNEVDVTGAEPRCRQYEGTFSEGNMSGRGILTTEDGRTFEGIWDNDQPLDGQWKITLRDGSKFSGGGKGCVKGTCDKQNNYGVVCPHGHGTMKYCNGDSYSGNFVDGQRSGKGICVFANGDRYEGEWSDDSLSVKGSGELRLADGTIHTFGGFTRDHGSAMRRLQ